MKNKAELNKDFEANVKPELKEAIDVVQMCAHDVRHTGKLEVSMQPEHTNHGKKVTFKFKDIIRKGSEDEVEGLLGDSEVKDIEYIGMEVDE